MDILMPQLGETVAEGTVTNWYKKVGDAVRADEALFDVETDKVATEIPSPVSGVLVEVLVPAGQTVKVGTRLAVVRPASQALDASTETRGAAATPATAAAGGSPAASAQAGAQASSVAPGQASFVTPTQAGAQPSLDLDSRLRGNDAVRSARAGTGPARAGTGPGSTPAVRTSDPRQKLSPVVRRLLAEHGIDPAAIRGSGRDGRVTREDVLNHIATAARTPLHAAGPQRHQPLGSDPEPAASRQIARLDAGAGASVAAGRQLAALPSGEEPGPREAAAQALRESERVVALNNVRRRSAAAMARAWQVVPHVLQAVEANYARIEQARSARQSAWQAREGFELTYLPFLAFAVCQALQRYEQLNARIEGDSLVVSRRVHLGIAVDLNHEGLVVPVIRDAQDRNVPALAREIRRLAVGARTSKLKPDDFSQPTYTISNSGVFGTLITAPIVNPPQVAILSTDAVSKRPVVVETPEGDSIAVRPVGVLAQSFDHRAVDGAYSAAFLKEVKRIVETRTWIDDVV